MRRSRLALRAGLGGAVAGAVGLVHGAFGQDVGAPAGLRLVVDYSLGFDVDTNEALDESSPGTYAALVNDFDFALLSNTRNQTFALTFGTQVRLESDPQEEDEVRHFEIEEPRYNLEYTRESVNSLLGVSASLLRQEIDAVEPFFIDLDGDTIVDEIGFTDAEGTLTSTELRFSLETGRTSPVGTTYTVGFQSRTFSETEDPSLYDRAEYRVATSTRLNLTDVTTGHVDLAYRSYEYSEGRDLDGESVSVSLGLSHQLSEILGFSGSLGYSKSREEETIEDVTFVETDAGPNASFRLTRELSNGSIFGAYSRRMVEDTFRNTLTFGRDISFANYSLSASFGVTNLDGGELAPTVGIVYTRSVDDAQFTAALRRTVTIDTDDEERVLTSATVGYNYTINELSSVGLGFDYALVSRPGDEAQEDDETRATFSATYRRSLTRDWGLTAGYRARAKSTDTADAFSNAVFVNVGRSFTLRP